MKKQKIQLPGHQQAIVPPTVKPPEDEESNPTASSSHDHTVPLPTTTPHSFTPSPAVPEDTADYDTPQSGSQETIQYHDPEDETEEPVLNEEEIEHLQSEDSESIPDSMNRNLRNLMETILYFLDTYRQRPTFNPMVLKVSRSFAST